MMHIYRGLEMLAVKSKSYYSKRPAITGQKCVVTLDG
jgi:hypothetical protein